MASQFNAFLAQTQALAPFFKSDVEVLTYALTLEHLEAEFYTMVVAGGKLQGNALRYLTVIRDHEVAHVDAITQGLQQGGATPVKARRSYNFAALGDMIVRSVNRLVEIPQKVPALARAAFLGEERDPNGPIGVVGVSRISGEVFAFEEFTTTEKISYFFQLLAGVNLVLFLFNLLPIYPLDGGHIAGALYEKARATVARLRGRPDPGPFDIARLMPVAYLVAGLFLGLSALPHVSAVITNLADELTLVAVGTFAATSSLGTLANQSGPSVDEQGDLPSHGLPLPRGR